jgi:predicted XRE-type DNA-binding protein
MKPRKSTTRLILAKRKFRGISVELGSGNVFADLGFPDAEERKTKVVLAVQILRILEERGLTQAAAARILGVNQPKVSALVNCRLEGFSVERLMIFLTALGRDVDITVRPRRSARTPGRIQVTAGR